MTRPRVHFLTDPLAAAFLAWHLGAAFAQPFRVALNYAPGDDARSQTGPKPHRYYLTPESVERLDRLPEAQRQAMRALGLWPESEAA